MTQSQHIKQEKLHSWVSNANSDIEEKEENELVNFYTMFVGNRRDTKALYKFHENVIGYYKRIIGHVKAKTMRKYGQIIPQFMIFSPTLDSKDEPEFLRLKLSYRTLDANSKKNKNSSTKQYATHKKISIHVI